MSRIRGKNTSPELIVRSLLHRAGYRFRLHQKIQCGMRSAECGIGKIQNSKIKNQKSFVVRPDIVMPKHKTAIFVHGCFWHRHRGCKNCTTPTHRREWWLAKLEGNAARDKKHQRALRKLGWRQA
jgi:DNA mismatch endonuclease (patch repair protein)